MCQQGIPEVSRLLPYNCHLSAPGTELGSGTAVADLERCCNGQHPSFLNVNLSACLWLPALLSSLGKEERMGRLVLSRRAAGVLVVSAGAV